MANTLLTIDMITNEAVRLWKNSNLFIQNIDVQYDDQFAVAGAKIGDTLRIRLPNDYVLRTGAAASVQDTAEQSTTMTVATQQGVDMSFTSKDLTMSLDDFSRRILAPAVNTTAGGVALSIMAGADGGVSNYVANTDGSGNIIAPTIDTVLQARAILAENSAPGMARKFVLGPRSMAHATSTLAGLFNPSQAIGEQYRSGEVKNALGFDWYEDQTVLAHTTASYSGTTTVNGAGQSGTAITVNAITGGLAQGDIITFAGVYAVNRITKQTTGQLRQFAVTTAVPSGGTTINVYPALVPANNGNAVQYQTVTASPANSAAIVVASASGAIYRKNIAYVPEAITMATADLVMPPNVEASRKVYDGVSMRMIRQYAIGTDQLITRMDVLYGFKYVRPEWCVVVADTPN